MKIVVIGGTGLIGSKLVTKLGEHGHEAVAGSPNTGVNTLTGEGLAEVLDGRRGRRRRVELALVRGRGGAGVLPDVDPQPARRGGGRRRAAITSRCRSSAPSACPTSGYFRAKVAQEKLIKDSSIPYSIVHATQFFEFVKSIADAATDGDTVRLPPVLFQPIAADDVASAVGRSRRRRAGERHRRDRGPANSSASTSSSATGLSARNDPREVVADPHARYFGIEVGERTLVPGDGARLGETRFEDWLREPAHR